ncbi:MAG: SPOR domain-containing protein [Luteimonas sp.]
MEPALKQRLWGAAVLIALAVIFLPMLIQGPAPESGVSDVSLDMPNAPGGEYETRELPLVTPGDPPNGGALGMQTSPADSSADIVSQSRPLGADNASSSAALPADAAIPINENLHAAVAGGDYAVSFGSYATAANAQAVVRALQQSQLPGFHEAITANNRTAYRVRIGPYATRAAAEAARLRAAHVRDDVGAAVVVLDAGAATPAPSTPAATSATPAVATAPLPPQPKLDDPKPTPVPKPVTAKPVEPNPADAAKPAPPAITVPAAANVGFAVQLGAFSKAADANALRDRVRAAGMVAFTEAVNTDKGTLTRVRAGPVASRAEADQLKAQVRAKIGVDGIVRPHP